MAVKVRLARHGRKNSPFYNIVAANSRSPRDGKFLEKLGYYNPKVNKEQETEQNKRLSFDEERVKYWVSVGAEVSSIVAKLLSKAGVAGLEGFVQPFTTNEFTGVKRKEKKKILAEREAEAKKALAEAKKKKEEAKKEAQNG